MREATSIKIKRRFLESPSLIYTLDLKLFQQYHLFCFNKIAGLQTIEIGSGT